MKRLAVVLAAVLPATGCFWGECSKSVTVDWPAFRLADGSSTGSCAAAGVSTIDVWVNNAFAGSFDCNGPAASIGVARGSNLLTVEALDAGNVIRYRDELFVDGESCGHLGVVDARPAEGLVDVSYTLSPVNSCYTPGPSFIWVYVRDDIADVIAADSSSAPESGNVCGVNHPLSFRLAAGDYSLLRTQEMIRAGGGTHATVARDCTTYSFTVQAAASASVAPVLFDATASCP